MYIFIYIIIMNYNFEDLLAKFNRQFTPKIHDNPNGKEFKNKIIITEKDVNEVI